MDVGWLADNGTVPVEIFVIDVRWLDRLVLPLVYGVGHAFLDGECDVQFH
jgi:hypothetical protein